MPAKYASISKLADAELDEIKHLPLNEIQSDDVEQSVGLALFSVQEIPKLMKQGQDEYARFLKKKPPDYKGITDNVAQTMQGLSDIVGKVIDGFNHSKDDKAVPAAIRTYMTDSQGKYAEIKKQADDLIKEEKGLGELKLDTLRDALRQKNPILVRGDKEWRVIRLRQSLENRHARHCARAGMWPITATALPVRQHDHHPRLLSLTQPAKAKVCFVRNGVAHPSPILEAASTALPTGYATTTYEVTEKDLSGMYAMQAMQQQQEAPPRTQPSDAEIADAVWVVDGATRSAKPHDGSGPPPSNGGTQDCRSPINKGFHYENGKKVEGGWICFSCCSWPHGDDMSEPR